ncbi:MAG: PhzF family phenazine biosynthesis protein [Gammaproteobacteria bacterium]|nr:MAG: PhzF family phenazine biosynthesis protein [Gammaproteobacteria bacterium]
MLLTIVDVFAERPLAGNQLAVVRDCEGLSDEDMQAIAREMNFSETTFVTREGGDEADVRIFTPATELPFAGHPTVGTAWVLSGGEGSISLNLEAGTVPVSFVDGIGWMTPPPVRLGDTFGPAKTAELINLPVDALDPDYPIRFAEVGPRFILIGVRDLASLIAARLSGELHQAYMREGLSVQCVFVFTAEAYGPDADFASRMFFDTGGVREDPATGSANTAFAAYLHDLRGGEFDVVVDQGVEMLRPSRLYLKVGKSPLVGGRTQLVSTGSFAEGLFD